MSKVVRWFVVVVGFGWMLLGGVAQAAQLTWWSHWASEENLKAIVVEVGKRFEAKHPGNTVKIIFYEKSNMWPALRATFGAGSGFPDVFYYDTAALEFIRAGWLADLSTTIRWENTEPSAKTFLTMPGPGGKVGTWALPIQAASEEIYFNKKMFRELGIKVPADYTFTQDEFKEVVSKCAKAGFAAFASGTADREWTALHIPTYLLFDKLGGEGLVKLGRGEISWKDPRVVEVFRYYKELIDLGAYPKALTSITLADAHRYFHTEQKACMFPISSWYTGRAFASPEKGGQPNDFELGLLNYPRMKDGKGHGEKMTGYTAAIAVAAKSPNLSLAIELANTWADIEIGNMWMTNTYMQTGIKTDPTRIESPRKWYFEEYSKVNKNTKWVPYVNVQNIALEMKPEMWAVWVATIGQGLPYKLIGPDAALEKLEAARLKFK